MEDFRYIESDDSSSSGDDFVVRYVGFTIANTKALTNLATATHGAPMLTRSCFSATQQIQFLIGGPSNLPAKVSRSGTRFSNTKEKAWSG